METGLVIAGLINAILVPSLGEWNRHQEHEATRNLIKSMWARYGV
jgi:hypothetical protein